MTNEEIDELHKNMQCKDIPTRPILEYVRDHGGIGCTWFSEISSERTVRKVISPNVPDKLVRAKMNNLIYKGLIDGCPCGCRGDYEITDKGLERIDGACEKDNSSHSP